MDTNNQTNHAKLFDIRGRQVLVYLDHDEEQDNLLIMRFRLWVDAVGGPVEANLTISGDERLSDKAVDIWEEGTIEAFDTIDAAKVENTLEKMGVFAMLEETLESAD